MEQVVFSEKVIRKHVAIIHAYSLMSVLQRKIVNMLLHESLKEYGFLNSQESVAIERRMSLASLAKAIGFNSNNTHYLKESIDDLASLKIEWNLLKDKAPTDVSFLNLRVLHGAPTFYQDGTFNFSFHKIMLALVNNPQIYGTIDLDLQAKFESKYSHSLYENSTRFVNLQKNKIVQLDTFRKLFGVESQKYQTMRELTRNVITPSLEEVNDRADFIVALNPLKIGRKIAAFELLVKNNKKPLKAIDANHQMTIDSLIKEIRQVIGFINDATLENIFRTYPKDYILEKITYVKIHAKKESTGLYPAAYFISALKNDYKSIDQAREKAETKKPELSNNLKKWGKENQLLQADVNYWKKMLDYAESANSSTSTNHIKQSLSHAEDKLGSHYLEKPLLEIEVV